MTINNGGIPLWSMKKIFSGKPHYEFAAVWKLKKRSGIA
jgi:hypothetical protein